MSDSSSARQGKKRVASRLSFLLFGAVVLLGRVALATSVIPLTDRELHARADVVVHGVVVSSDVTVDSQGRPETLTIVEPLEVLKGSLAGSLVLHQLGGELPDGTFFKMWGRPEYLPGREVVVFAVARSSGEYETAEMLLGKFEVQQDEAGHRFAVSDLAAGVRPGVDVLPDASPEVEGDAEPAGRESRGERTKRSMRRVAGVATFSEAVAVRPLDGFIASLRRGVFEASSGGDVVGELKAVTHDEKVSRGKGPLWGHISNAFYRWNNNATAAWTFSGTANTDSGGGPEAQAALDMWTNHPISSINYTSGAGSSNVIYLNATTSILGCGWSTCLSGAGVIGCGGPGGGASNSWRGDSYSTISNGTVELRAYCSKNAYGTVTTQSVLEHELGHTLGLGHSDQNVSAHDTCRGDEGAAIMRSSVQSRTSLGTDDEDAIRWLYGDGGTSCTVPAITSLTANVAFPSVAGTSIQWTAAATGGAALQYRFWRLDVGAWSIVQDYGASNTYSWTPASNDVGGHAVIVWVKSSGSASSYDAWTSTPTFNIASTVTNPSLTANRSFASPVGTSITWTAAANGPAPLQYRFWRNDNAVWTIVQDYSSANTYTWTPTGNDVGQHAVVVWVKNAGSAAAYDAWTSTPNFQIASLVTIGSLTANRAFPSHPGTSITWTASASGPAALQYRFWRKDNGAWTMVRDYSALNTYSWTPAAGDLGTHAIIVWVKNSSSPAAWDAWTPTADFQITP